MTPKVILTMILCLYNESAETARQCGNSFQKGHFQVGKREKTVRSAERYYEDGDAPQRPQL